jgi:hypothetical protein
MSGQQPAPRRNRWRRWNNAIHRDLGYFCVALTLVYAISGIAVNHIHHWNPNYRVERIEHRFEPFAVGDKATMVRQAVERLSLPSPTESFRPDPERLQLFYDGWTVEVLPGEGIAVEERPRDRPVLRDLNFLHLNHPKGLWTYVADIYALLLVVMVVTGVLVLKGRTGLAGRGKWFVLAGLLVPLVFVVVLRYLG